MSNSEAPPAQNPSTSVRSIMLAANVADADETAELELGEAYWESIFAKADSVQLPMQIEAQGGWQAGFNPFMRSGFHPDEWENYDVWLRCSFELPSSQHEATAAPKRLIIFGGLATIADVWLNGQHILHSDNMFLQHNLDVDDLLNSQNQIYIRVAALTPHLEQRKPRPKWRTTFAQHKNTAWYRTSLLGRIPTWSSSPPAIGPWRPIIFLQQRLIVHKAYFDCSLEGERGRVNTELCLSTSSGQPIENVELQVGDQRIRLPQTRQTVGNGIECKGELCVDKVEAWWPHTHGQPKLYDVTLYATIGGIKVIKKFDPIGFRVFNWRNLALAATPDDVPETDFGLSVNGVEIFCRGACWTPLDFRKSLTKASVETTMRAALLELRDAGINMLRVSGTFNYEHDVFYRLCDELGVLVWQDFMFARLAYPFDETEFYRNAETECLQVLHRLRGRASIAMLCGNSEIEQQTVMLGMPLNGDHHAFFRETLAAWCVDHAPAITYWPSSPAGGALPFKVTQGVSHYFGVGGYRRSLDDARVNTPRFASECLAFSHVPENRGLLPFLPGQAAFPTHPDYKAGVPRDVSSGWDFSDINDHYMETLFCVDTRALRHQNPERYFYLSKVCCGEVMSRVIAQWRSQSSPCNGALIWLLRDLQMGAGWGLIDAEGLRKSIYYYLKRVWQPLCLWFVDNGLDGLSLHLANEKSAALSAELELLRYTADGKVAASKRIPLNVAERQQKCWNVEALLGGFFDSTYAYRFGPREFTLLHARLWAAPNDSAQIADRDPKQPDLDSQQRDLGLQPQALLAEAFYYPIDTGLHISEEPELEVWAEAQKNGDYELVIKTKRFARALAINVYPFLTDDNYFDMAPGTERRVKLAASLTDKPLRGAVAMFNGHKSYPISIREPGA